MLKVCKQQQRRTKSIFDHESISMSLCKREDCFLFQLVTLIPLSIKKKNRDIFNRAYLDHEYTSRQTSVKDDGCGVPGTSKSITGDVLSLPSFSPERGRMNQCQTHARCGLFSLPSPAVLLHYPSVSREPPTRVLQGVFSCDHVKSDRISRSERKKKKKQKDNYVSIALRIEARVFQVPSKGRSIGISRSSRRPQAD